LLPQGGTPAATRNLRIGSFFRTRGEWGTRALRQTGGRDRGGCSAEGWPRKLILCLYCCFLAGGREKADWGTAHENGFSEAEGTLGRSILLLRLSGTTRPLARGRFLPARSLAWLYPRLSACDWAGGGGDWAGWSLKGVSWVPPRVRGGGLHSEGNRALP